MPETDAVGDKKQLNFALDEAASKTFERVKRRAERRLGIELSQAQLVGLALKALEEQYDAEDAAEK